MADRTSARIFGQVFEILAAHPTETTSELALRVFRLTHGYDFSEGQMEAEEALTALGLCRRVADPDQPGETVCEYGPEPCDHAECQRSAP